MAKIKNLFCFFTRPTVKKALTIKIYSKLFCPKTKMLDPWLLFLSTYQREQQLQASIQEEYAQKEQYSVSDTKTKLN